ncbi:MAG: hypothetical protein KKA90_00515 [Nanoarchaeota archaeon]|nr:hypothetical protein [Nanoarchaeota archaeon]
MRKERSFALFLVALMLLSAAGFAVSFTPVTQSSSEEPEIILPPPIVERALTTEEVLSALRTGRLIYTYTTPEACESCEAMKTTLSDFVTTYPAFAIIVFLEGEQEELTVLLPSGEFVPIETPIDVDELLETYCENSYIKPKECLLLQI